MCELSLCTKIQSNMLQLELNASIIEQNYGKKVYDIEDKILSTILNANTCMSYSTMYM